MKTKIGIMGGTFNPIHYGHLLIAENACEQFHLSQVFFLPTGNHAPHKDSSKITEASVRSEMVKLAICDNHHFQYSDYELRQKEIGYTYRTLLAFDARYPDAELYFIMGADSLAYFDKWRHPDKISEHCTILAAVRDELDYSQLEPIRRNLKNTYGTKIEFINSPNFEVSSHLIREKLQKKQSIKYLLPEAVEQYILQHQLYLI